MLILAHRGWWTTPAEKNSPAALEKAFAAGFGVETDLRDLDGDIVISHDPPRRAEGTGGPMTLTALLDLYAAYGQPGNLALNIKADGLQAGLEAALASAGVQRYFVFDMSVPDALGYLKRGLTAYSRLSEYEPQPSFLDSAAGVWVDAFLTDWVTASALEDLSRLGKRIALVSPELHGRPHQAVWSRWREALSPELLADVALCTDYPDAAERFFGASAKA